MRRLFYIVLCLLAVVATADARSRRSSKDVEEEQTQNQREIDHTQREIDQNKSDISRQLDLLKSLNAKIEKRTDSINRLQKQINKLNTDIKRMDDSISTMTENLNTLRRGYSETLRQIRSRRQSVSDFTFIFSAKSFSQAWSRIRYLSQVAKLAKQRAADIETAAAELTALRKRQEQARSKVNASLERIKRSQAALLAERKNADKLVSQLKHSEKSLKKELKRRQRLAEELENELNEIIEAELAEQRRREEEAQREAERRRKELEAKPSEQPQSPAPAPNPAPKNDFAAQAEATRKLSGSFESNKGRLLFPVSGNYTIIEKFGRSEYKSEVKSLTKTENHGITIEVPEGTQTRAVFQGEVIAIFNLAEYRNIVMVNHGKYTTVYAGIDRLFVSKGDKVKTGQALGELYTDGYTNRTILNFQVRRETKKLDPLDWVK